jgi:hypothetical protein
LKFIFPDSLDLVDPSFNFDSEERSEFRVRQRDDLYAHEVFASTPFDGLLVSKGIVDGIGSGSRYTLAQRHRLLRHGVREFFRLDQGSRARMLTVGDCGAFSYVKETTPPFSPDEVIDFYDTIGFDWGMSVDHVILQFEEDWDETLPGIDPVPREVVNRQSITLELAAEFIKRCRERHVRFEPVGVVQGWSPKSYANAAKRLQKMGFRRLAIGGLVPLRTPDIESVVRAVSAVRQPAVPLHLLGVTRITSIPLFASLGVASFDSTSPLRQAFKDDKDNYYAMNRTYPAIRIPQVEGHVRLRKLISMGKVDPVRARKMELQCLSLVRKYECEQIKAKTVLDAILEYAELCEDNRAAKRGYLEVLEDKPWRSCPCEVCQRIGINVILFRGAERNRRRGFHNVWVFAKRLAREMAPDGPARSRIKSKAVTT